MRAQRSGVEISVVLPTHNRAAHLRGAIDSVLAQTMSNLELVVVDDGSTDQTGELLASVHDPRLKVIRMATRQGAPAARNVGIRAASAPLVAFQDSDVVWHPDRLGRTAEALAAATDDAAVAYSRVRRHRSTEVVHLPRARNDQLHGDLRRALPLENFIDLPSATIRATALIEVGGFDERMPRYQDWDLWLSLCARHTFAFVDEVLVDSYELPDSISLDLEAHYAALALLLTKHRQLFREAPEARVRYRLQLGLRSARERRPLTATRQLADAIAAAPVETLMALGRRVWSSRSQRGPSAGP